MTDASRPRVALVLPWLFDIAGGGGAERQFGDVFDMYPAHPGRSFDLNLVTDPLSLVRLRAAGRIREGAHNIIEVDLRRDWERVWQAGGAAKWAMLADATARQLAAILSHRFAIVHFPMLGLHKLPLLLALSALPRPLRPAISINILDCALGPHLSDRVAVPAPASLRTHVFAFRWVALDGVLSWYEEFKRAALAQNILRSRPYVHAARYCFCDAARFRPGAQRRDVVVFAARMIDIKRPLFFVEGVRLATQLAPELLARWEIRMYGRGPLEEAVREAITSAGLDGKIVLDYTADMAPVLATTRVFVSTQDLENFTSLAMLEAMAAGNAIVARPVGQTHYFLRHRVNGLMMDEDTPMGLAKALVELLGQPATIDRLGRESRRLATEEHTATHFLGELDAYWAEVVAHAAASRASRYASP
jgi:glycosyltransferase involved in cell wall biosynthesis